MNEPAQAPVSPPLPAALKRFIWDFQSVIELAESEREIFMIGRDVLARLLAEAEILPQAFAAAKPARPQTYQLYRDGMARFCPLSLVLAPGQASEPTPAPFWRIGGVATGSVLRRQFAPDASGVPAPNGEKRLDAGVVETARAGGWTQWVNNSTETAVLVLVLGGDTGAEADNGPDAPPFDIWSIQTRIED